MYFMIDVRSTCVSPVERNDVLTPSFRSMQVEQSSYDDFSMPEISNKSLKQTSSV